MAAAVMFGGLHVPVTAYAGGNIPQTADGRLADDAGVTVTTRGEFMNALQQRKSPILVQGLIVIGEEADANGRMLPVMIPEHTLIQGTPGSEICSRSPVQLEGDGVCFKDVKLTFESSDALGSVPHREIFLAGHSLTLDGVNTYLDGEANIGPFGGTEKELLPTVYAGGYSNTTVSENASLTVKNSGSETMFQAIYMGHEAGIDNKASYSGRAVLNLDADVTVREVIDTSRNSQAEINISGAGNQYAKAKSFIGNENTTLTLNSIFIEAAELQSIPI